MPNYTKELLEAFQAELHFLESGGYEPSVRNPREELKIFWNSPSCLNYGFAEKKYPCSACWLIDFVPEDKRGEAMPCHHIPLNERGDTLAGLPYQADDPRVQETMEAWLRKNIARLEGELAKEIVTAAR